MTDTGNLLLDILALFGGGRGRVLNELTPHLLASLFWGGLSLYLLLTLHGKRSNTDRLAIASTLVLFVSELGLFIAALAVATEMVVPMGLRAMLSPLESGLGTVGKLLLSAAFLQLLLRQRELTISYLSIGLSVIGLAVLYQQLPALPDLLDNKLRLHNANLNTSAWASHAPAILLLGFAIVKMLGSTRKIRWPIVIAMACLTLASSLALIVDQAQTSLGSVLDPIRGNLQVWVIPFVAYIFMRVHHVEGRRRKHTIEASERMEALGQLSSGIAHDFNNHLQIILGYTELAKSVEQLSLKQRMPLDKIEHAAESAGALVNQLLAFSRGQPTHFSPVDINEVITRLTPMLSRLLGSDIRLINDLDLDVQPINADTHMLEQIIINLVVNAKDAIKHSGNISMQSRALSKQENNNYTGEAGTERVQLLVADSGTGMDEKTLRRVFEPFFTTKPIGQGTGLGLSTVYSSVQKHNGSVVIKSEPGLYTRVYIEFPVCKESTLPPPDRQTPARLSTGVDETILLAEDETTIRDLTQTLLSSAGYNVLIARDGQHAINILQTYKASISLCVFDVSMPVLSGYDTYDHVARTHPNIPVLFITGNTSRVAHIRSHLPHLQKPFSKSSLLRMVRRILDKEIIK